MEAGLPRGVLQVLPGDGPAVGEPLGLNPDVDMVSFTGSTETGRRFLRYAADSNLKKVVLECGGKNPAIVLEDAENLELVAEQIVNGAFWNMGEKLFCDFASDRPPCGQGRVAGTHGCAHARTENWRPSGAWQPPRRAH